MIAKWIIEKKRDNQELSKEEIHFFMNGYNKGDIPDYQMSALAMAIYFNGMTSNELAVLTDVMMQSGDILNKLDTNMPIADKHSTGGIGDKISLLLAPLAASCGVAIPMISGRGLGITGGTLDKMESIPGYKTNISTNEFMDIVKKCGCSIIGQTKNIAPIDKKLYALRDVTGTVPSIPLISASIMSKKLAENTDILVLDVKFGKGAFMQTKEQATILAETMIRIGRKMGKKMSALITDMNQPLGYSAGNVLEVLEIIDCLNDKGPSDIMELTYALTAEILILADVAKDNHEALELMKKQIASGAVKEKFKEMIQLHHGDPSVIDTPSKLSKAKLTKNILSNKKGYIQEVNAELIGKACILLKAGRTVVSDAIDHSTGISNIIKIGDYVDDNSILMTIHANDKNTLLQAEELLKNSVTISSTPIKTPSIINDIIK